MRNTLHCLASLFLLIVSPALAQQIAIPKLVIPIGILHARVAIIGNGCTITSKGKDGEHAMPVTKVGNRDLFSNKNLYNQQKGAAGQKGGEIKLTNANASLTVHE